MLSERQNTVEASHKPTPNSATPKQLTKHEDNTALYYDWQDHLSPQINKLRRQVNIVDNIFAREVLALCYDRYCFEAIDSESWSQEAMEHYYCQLLPCFMTEKRQPKRLWITTRIDSRTEKAMAAWFRGTHLDPKSLKIRLTTELCGEFPWQMFQMGLRHCVCDDTEIWDPVTFGGTLAYFTMNKFISSDCWSRRLAYFEEKVNFIIQFVADRKWGPVDATAAQAICVFLETHPVACESEIAAKENCERERPGTAMA
ncbi:hypothetical protein HDZ31DRAFT_77527 [Schizophyllum fasciatum]